MRTNEAIGLRAASGNGFMERPQREPELKRRRRGCVEIRDGESPRLREGRNHDVRFEVTHPRSGSGFHAQPWQAVVLVSRRYAVVGRELDVDAVGETFGGISADDDVHR